MLQPTNNIEGATETWSIAATRYRTIGRLTSPFRRKQILCGLLQLLVKC